MKSFHLFLVVLVTAEAADYVWPETKLYIVNGYEAEYGDGSFDEPECGSVSVTTTTPLPTTQSTSTAPTTTTTPKTTTTTVQTTTPKTSTVTTTSTTSTTTTAAPTTISTTAHSTTTATTTTASTTKPETTISTTQSPTTATTPVQTTTTTVLPITSTEEDCDNDFTESTTTEIVPTTTESSGRFVNKTRGGEDVVIEVADDPLKCGFIGPSGSNKIYRNPDSIGDNFTSTNLVIECPSMEEDCRFTAHVSGSICKGPVWRVICPCMKATKTNGSMEWRCSQPPWITQCDIVVHVSNSTVCMDFYSYLNTTTTPSITSTTATTTVATTVTTVPTRTTQVANTTVTSIPERFMNKTFDGKDIWIEIVDDPLNCGFVGPAGFNKIYRNVGETGSEYESTHMKSNCDYNSTHCTITIIYSARVKCTLPVKRNNQCVQRKRVTDTKYENEYWLPGGQGLIHQRVQPNTVCDEVFHLDRTTLCLDLNKHYLTKQNN